MEKENWELDLRTRFSKYKLIRNGGYGLEILTDHKENLFGYFKEMTAKARQEVMMTELVHCEEAIERARQEITDWSLKQQEKAYRIGIDIGRQDERREIAEWIKRHKDNFLELYDNPSPRQISDSLHDDLIKHLEEQNDM